MSPYRRWFEIRDPSLQPSDLSSSLSSDPSSSLSSTVDSSSTSSLDSDRDLACSRGYHHGPPYHGYHRGPPYHEPIPSGRGIRRVPRVPDYLYPRRHDYVDPYHPQFYPPGPTHFAPEPHHRYQRYPAPERHSRLHPTPFHGSPISNPFRYGTKEYFQHIKDIQDIMIQGGKKGKEHPQGGNNYKTSFFPFFKSPKRKRPKSPVFVLDRQTTVEYYSDEADIPSDRLKRRTSRVIPATTKSAQDLSRLTHIHRHN